MSNRTVVGVVILAIGAISSVLLATWIGPWHAGGGKAELAELRASVASLLEETRETLKNQPEPDLAEAQNVLRSATQVGQQTAQRLNSIEARVQSVPAFVSPGFGGGGGFSWDKGGTIQELNNLRQALQQVESLTADANSRIGRASLALLDLNRRVSDVEKRVGEELKKMSSQVAALSEPQRILTNIWIPFVLSVVTIAGGISTIWLGWRKDLRDAVEVQVRKRDREIAAPSPASLRSSADA